MPEDELITVINTVSHLRGQIIGRATTLEMMMNIFLAKHFCKTKELQNQILEIVFASKKYTFDNKRDSMLAIIKNDTHYKSFYDLNKSLDADLKSIAKHRNIFAHYILNNTEDGLLKFRKGIISFIKFENKSSPVDYSDADLHLLEDLINNTTDKVKTLISTISIPPPTS